MVGLDGDGALVGIVMILPCFCSNNSVDLELQAQVEDSLTPEQRLVDGVLRRAGERRRKLRERARTGIGKRRVREKVEWGNREDGENFGEKRKVVFRKAVWRVE